MVAAALPSKGATMSGERSGDGTSASEPLFPTTTSRRAPGLTEDQRRGVETAGKSLLMSAAAGSGKTRVLAERCAYLVCDATLPHRCDVDELLVVTFTEAAAAEMRERIGRTLRGRLAARPGDARLVEQVARVDQAQIGTLHGFCAQVLRQNFHLVGLDPAFGVADAHEALLLRLEVGRDVLRRRYDTDADGRFQRLLDGYFDGDDERLLHEVLRVHELTQSLVDPKGWSSAAKRRSEEAAAKPLLACEFGRDLVDLIRRRITGIGQRCNTAMTLLKSVGGFAEYEQRVLEIYQLCRHLYKLVDAAGVDAVAQEVEAVEFPRLKPVKSTVPNKELAKDALDGVVREFRDGPWRNLLRFTEAQWQDGMAKVVPHARELLDLVELFGGRYRRAKDDSRQVDFSDLERYALRVLRDGNGPDLRPSAAARYYHRAFKHVLVDEYQDINELQNAILTLVSHLTGGKSEVGSVKSEKGDEAPSGSPLSHFTLHASHFPPNLFSVGDVKQSIYRFRLADPAQFLAREQALRHGDPDAGEVIDLRQNFRSRGPLLEAVNAVFERLMSKASAELDYDETQRLVPGRRFADPGGRAVFPGAPIELHVLPRAEAAAGGSGADVAADAAGSDDDGDAGLDRTEREAAFVAQRILQIVGKAGALQTHVYDREGDVPRPARYRDIVILLRSQKYKANQYVRILEGFGIPTHADAGSGFFDSTEVKDVVALLCLLDNGSQDLELAAHLRSPLARLDDPEDAMATVRVAYRNARGKPTLPFHEAVARYVDEHDDALAGRLRAVLDRLADLRRRANRQPVHETIWAVYHETGYLAYVAGLPGGPQRAANLTDMYDRARRFATHRRQGLGRFLDFLKTLEADADLGQPSVSNAAADVVRVMTVHASKGLEFPIVFVPDVGKRINVSDESGAVLSDRHLGLGMAVADDALFARYPSLGQVVVKDRIHRKLIAEELRVLYVALTRAMEHLILVGTAPGSAAEGWQKRWAGHLGPLPEAAVVGAQTVLDWLGPVWAAESAAGRPTLELETHALGDLTDPRSQWTRRERSPLAAALCAGRPLDDAPPLSPAAAAVVARLEYAYRHAAATR
ncbi:MAG: ATP-dependent deoxyribonuclease subunit, partial [Phycisphaerales bacterium]|nr:ATP-dependent deoxyribonuclease subunit [Phycisphaerales bacterium]